MDLISAFSIAAGVSQFAGVSIKVISTASEIYKFSSGLDKESAEASSEADKIHRAAASLYDGLNVIRSYRKRLDRDQKRLEAVSHECVELSAKLKDELDKLRLGERNRKRRLVWTALMAVAKNDTLKDMKTRLQTIQRELQMELLVSLW